MLVERPTSLNMWQAGGEQQVACMAELYDGFTVGETRFTLDVETGQAPTAVDNGLLDTNFAKWNANHFRNFRKFRLTSRIDGKGPHFC